MLVDSSPPIVARLKSFISLPGYSHDLWLPEHDSIAVEFFQNPHNRRLLLYILNGQLQISQHPSPRIDTLMYVIKTTTCTGPVALEQFDKCLHYGTLKGDVLDNLLVVMHSIYMPIFLDNHRWPEVVKKDFANQLQKFMANVTDAVFRLKGQTVLYAPTEELSDVQAIVNLKDFVQRSESLLFHWICQIKEVMNNQLDFDHLESTGPLEEIQFWGQRFQDLFGIVEQLNRPDVKQLIEILGAAKSSYLDQFSQLSSLIEQALNQAQDNLKFLSILSTPCQQLAEADLKVVPTILPTLLYYIRFIWAHSRFYNTKERLTNLLRKVSSEIMKRCCSKISLDEIFNGNVQLSMLCLQDSIDCCEAWKAIYKKTCMQISIYAERSWDFDHSGIFAQIDAFVQRCRDLLEVCEGQIQFARKINNGKKTMIPVFSGSKGSEISKGFEDIEIAFERQIRHLWQMREFILNVKTTKWHDVYNTFKQGVKDLEVMLQNIITTAFESSTTVDGSVYLLEIFCHLAKREAIKHTVEKKVADVYIMFLKELNSVKLYFENHRRTPHLIAAQPNYAGAAFWARSILRRINGQMATLRNAGHNQTSHLSQEVKTQYESLVEALEEYIIKSHNDWIAQLDSSIASKIESTLMIRRPDGFLELQFDKNLLRMFCEVHYWQKLKLDIPYQVHEMFSKREELRVLRDSVLLLIRDYNNILEMLTPEQLLLFKERIRSLDRKINPGLTTLTWASKGIADYYVRECRKHAQELHQTIIGFLESNADIQKLCVLISETLLWLLEPKKIYTLEEFELAQDKHRQAVQMKLKSAHQKIQQTLQTTHELFRRDGKQVHVQWGKYVEKVDQAVEGALRLTVHKSMQELSRAIYGEGNNRDMSAEVQPMFKVHVILENSKIEFSPSLQKLEEVVNRIAREMMSTISVLPHLSDTFTLNEQEATNSPSMYETIAREEEILKMFVNIQNGMASNTVKCHSYIRNWDSYREIWEINKDAFIRRYAKLKPALSTFDADINRYSEVANNAQKEETITNINFVRLDCSPLKHALVAHCHIWQNKLTTLLNTNAAQDLFNLYDVTNKKTVQLLTSPTNLDELAEKLMVLGQLQSDMSNIESQFGPIREQYQILEKYEVPIKPDEKFQLENLQQHWITFVQNLNTAEKALQEHKENFKIDLLVKLEDFQKSIILIQNDLTEQGPFNSTMDTEKAKNFIHEFQTQLVEMANQERMIQKGLMIFSIEKSPSTDIEAMMIDLDLLSQIWRLHEEWNSLYSIWCQQSIWDVDVHSIDEAVEQISKKLAKCDRDGLSWDVSSVLRDRINQMKRVVPILESLNNPALRERHWDQLTEQIGKAIDPQSGQGTIEKVLEVSVDQFSESIFQLSATATKELSIEQSLSHIQEVWDQMDLDVITYKNHKYYKIKSLDKVFELLEDNQVTLTSIKGSAYFMAFQSHIDQWEKTLSLIIEILDLLMHVQKQWIYLENIFVGADDIRKQLPKESAVFDVVNTKWIGIMHHIYADRKVLRTAREPNLVYLLTDMAAKLEKIQKSLDMYLETKRQFFPRFYFLSNDDLLEILGQAKEPNLIQSQLKKCFDGLTKLEVQESGVEGRRHFEALGMYSADGEYVAFTNPVIMEGPVESWLSEVEQVMHTTLRKLLLNCLTAVRKVKKDKWLKDWPGQLLILTGKISWTVECMRALADITKNGNGGMKSLKRKQASLLKKLADIMKSSLSEMEHKKLLALITSEVHNRDVIDKLMRSNSTDINGFEWLSQMRFYWSKDDDDCMIHQTNTKFKYGYEYLGNNSRMVITPLTERCFLTLTMALNLHRGGNLQGPAGTGKTETVKELGKTLGKYVFVQNCSDGLDHKSMARMLSGLAQTGAYGCFDEFNRIDIEVLSVVALQISCILSAVSRKARTFVFEDREIHLNLNCGIFITMNPTYIGRVDLPDNVKSLFRPIAMVVPDNCLISEILLFAAGFSNTKNLARKVDSLYRLAANHLSKQDHYDFGLRAITSALKIAGICKRIDFSVSDDIVLLTTLHNVNISKLTAEDVPLFLGILSDLFPGTEMSINPNEIFIEAVRNSLTSIGHQCVEKLVSKVVQLYETKLSRHGIMIVGNVKSGKTTIWKTLQSTLETLGKLYPEKYTAAKSYIINPKASPLGELYGEWSLVSNEWTDGILPNIMRACCSDTKNDEKWIILDGPVDPIWIESMNSVLDDNKMLTLINGERIALMSDMLLLFEVEDLAMASPATVSRCGMIYMDYEYLGWRPYIQSWLAKKPVIVRHLLQPLVDKFVPKILSYRQLWSEFVPVPELSIIQMFCAMFDSIATAENGINVEMLDNKESITWSLESLFLFSIIWSFGGPLTETSRRKFDMQLREIEGQFPSKNTVFDYCVDELGQQWVSWEDRLPTTWRYPNHLPFHKIFVPTVDTLRNEFLLSCLLQAKQSFLVVGNAGTGKTSLIQNMLNSASEATTLTVNCTAQTTSASLQSALDRNLEKRTKNVFVPSGGKPLNLFIDDLNMPMKDKYGSQPTLEFLRHWMTYGFYYDKQKKLVKYVNDIQVVSAMGPPGGGRNEICPRIQGCFHLLHMTFPDDQSLFKIYTTILNQKLQDFNENIKPLGDVLTKMTIELYHSIISTFLPTPAKIHYLFNLRDISRVFQGMLRAQRDYYDSQDALIKLWIHELYRVFHDRLIEYQDKDAFYAVLNEKMEVSFPNALKQLCPDKRIPLFTDFLDGGTDTNIYQEVEDKTILRDFVKSKLISYNSQPGIVQLDLVLFWDAIEHICRIVRVLQQPRGNLLLLGVGGSGRQSLSKLAAYIVGMQLFQIKLTKHYRMTEFREDLKELYRQSGIYAKPTLFLISDSHIIEERFLEDFSALLSTADIQNLFTDVELNEIKEKLIPIMSNEKINSPETAFYNFFLQRVQQNLHSIFCLSPIGENFRNRIRMYPALVNCCAIDWFSEWPKDALEEVAIKYLGQAALDSDHLRKSISQVFVTMHTSVIQWSRKMATDLKRHNHVTPINFLESVLGYCNLLSTKKEEMDKAAKKLQHGLSKLDDTKKHVEKMSSELEQTKKQVIQFQKQCEDFLVIIIQQKREADEQAKTVVTYGEKLKVEEEQVRGIASAAQADLDHALPALYAATKALEALNKKDLQEIKSYGKPPLLVEKVLEAIMILKKCEPTWDEAKKQLGSPNFIKQLINFDKDGVTDKILKKISQYCSDENFNPDIVGKVSGAAKSLCMWVKAIEVYCHIYRTVAPKREKLQLAQENLRKKQLSLNEAQSRLLEIQGKIDSLQEQYDEKATLKTKLRMQSEETELRLTRAEALVSGLSGEQIRWEKSIKGYQQSLKYLPGDCLVAAAFLSYAGPFNSLYRHKLVHDIWLPLIISLEVPCNPEFSLPSFFGKITEIRDWNMQGLPKDNFSVENAIIVTRGQRFPLLVDPQGQAATWIKNMELVKNVQIIDLKQPDYMRIIENCLQLGVPVIAQGLLENVDPALNPILNRSVVKVNGRSTIRLDDQDIEYNPNFRLYLITKLSNPHYSPEIAGKATIVNFALKEKGLEDQLLGMVVRKEKPHLEEQKDNLMTNVVAAKKRLVELEDEILDFLTNAQGSLLEDEKLVQTLRSSKALTEQVISQLKISEETEAKIDAAREEYRECAQRASVLFFVLNSLGSLDPMYQFSLDSYINLFHTSMLNSKQSEDLSERVTALNDYHTYEVYRFGCQAIFQHHKQLFCFQIVIKILENSEKLDLNEYNFLLNGGRILDRDSQTPNPCSEWIRDIMWDNITQLEKFSAFQSLASSIEQNEREWRNWFLCATPEETSLPADWGSKLTEFQKLLIVRSLRPDRIVFSVQNFIANNLGLKYVEPLLNDLSVIVQTNAPTIPILLLLSSGVDPTNDLHQLAIQNNMGNKFYHVSLGQGQTAKAMRLIQDGIKSGNWVFLANCHLSMSWMPTLEKILETLSKGNPHPNFRLWLSSQSHAAFPIAILHSAIKVTTDPPKGLKSNMMRLYSKLSADKFNECRMRDCYKTLVFAFCFFHSVVLERRKFLSLGWNSICDFNDADFEIGESILSSLLNEYQELPWDAVKCLIAEANYGGRITDDWDRRVLRSYINTFFSPNIIQNAHYSLSSLSTYFIPEPSSIESYLQVISSWPNFDLPEAFGQNSNADIAAQTKESNNLLTGLMSLQPSSKSLHNLSVEETASVLIPDILKWIPEKLDSSHILNNGLLVKNSLNIVLLQEIRNYNTLLVTIQRSLTDLQSGLKGALLMTPALEDILGSILDGKVPQKWSGIYLSVKPLASWTHDLNLRVGFMAEWAKGNEPKCYWLGGFTFPAGFLTAVLQQTARKSNIPVDALSWEHTVLQVDDDTQIQQGPKDGIYVTGIFLEGASWDKKGNCLNDSRPLELVSALPPIHFRPVETKRKILRGVYTCPIYYFPIRGTVSDRPSFVSALDLRVGDHDSDYYVKRGTACLLSNS
ncbi:dynein heavy chain and region D6 of dynein motor-domain-containing protein [Paraphysoderma sedebokerense]|nr:dynein heavy chain and region D6 of dynein motor-domain-containing protein [Paraphysoderma sedebokerense]